MVQSNLIVTTSSQRFAEHKKRPYPIPRFSLRDRRSYTSFLLFFLSVFLILTAIGIAQTRQILMDGKFDDWQTLAPIHEDVQGDQQTGSLDFGKLWISNDINYLYLCVEVGHKINLQASNDIILLLDADDNPNTGMKVNGVGAELTYNFGEREGEFFRQSGSIAIKHSAIGLVTLPTVTSDRFEIAISRTALPDKKTPLFSGSQISLVLKDFGDGGDRLPDKGALKYVFTDSNFAAIKSISIKKENKSSLRLLTYNVLNDGLFKESQSGPMLRILAALNPDIIAFDEIYSHSAAEAAAQVETVLPSLKDQKWFTEKVGKDIIVISRYPIESHYLIDGNGAFIINPQPEFNSKLLLIAAHLPCCNNNDGRQLEIDAIMNFIRDAKTSLGEATLPDKTPIIIAGDLNLVGFAQQLKTLLTGDIVNRHLFGQPFLPDWDNSEFADLAPRCVNISFSYTWFDANSAYSPGKLDYMIYSDSVIQPAKKFVLFTPTMPTDTLAAHNLKADDALNASDHLAVVADFVLIKN